MLGRWEWLIIEVVVVGFLVAELISVRRSMARDKAQAAREQEDRGSRAGPPNPHADP